VQKFYRFSCQTRIQTHNTAQRPFQPTISSRLINLLPYLQDNKDFTVAGCITSEIFVHCPLVSFECLILYGTYLMGTVPDSILSDVSWLQRPNNPRYMTHLKILTSVKDIEASGHFSRFSDNSEYNMPPPPIAIEVYHRHRLSRILSTFQNAD
jgi:hypothetical protein